MIIQGGQRGSHEKAYGLFYASRNEWTADFTSGIRGLDIKGTVVSIEDSISSIPATGGTLGQCVNIGVAVSNASMMPIGVLESSMVMGRDPLTNTWVNVLMYGHSERIRCASSTAVDSGDVGLYVNDLSGAVTGISAVELQANRSLVGTFFLQLSGAAETIYVDLGSAAPFLTSTEALADTDLDNTPAVWTGAGDFATPPAGTAVYTHAAGSGTFTQASASFATAVDAASWYKITYDLVSSTNITAFTVSGVTTAPVALSSTVGTNKYLLVLTDAVPGDFVLTATSTAGGAMVLDNIRFQKVSHGWISNPVATNTPVVGSGGIGPTSAMIGYHYTGDSPVLVEEQGSVTGTATQYYKVRGFVNCFGISGIGR